MTIRFDILKTGTLYDRNSLASMWGYKGWQAFSRGVFAPKNTNMLILFVTKENQDSLMK